MTKTNAVPVGTLPVGSAFVCPWHPGQTGRLLHVSSSCATVMLDREKASRTFVAQLVDGTEKEVTLPGGREKTTWSNDTRVVPTPEAIDA